MKKAIGKYAILYAIGGLIYEGIEIAARGHTHWTMFLVGGLCFVLVGGINNWISWDMLFELQMLIGGAVITCVEFFSGMIINVYFGLNVWDYSNRAFNLMGQICLLFSLAWCLLSAVAIVLDDYLRYWLFGEDRPVYHFWKKKEV